MKPRLLYSFIVILSFIGHVEAQKLNVSNDHTIFYRGLKNPLHVSLDGYRQDQLVVKVRGGKLITDKDKRFVIPDDDSRILYIKAGIRTGKGHIRWLDSQECRIRKLPPTQTLFGSSEGGIISKAQLIIVRNISAGLGFGFAIPDQYFIIRSYDMLIIGSRVLYIQHVKGAVIPYQAQRIFETLKGGELIYVYNVNATFVQNGADHSKEVNTLPVTIRVKIDNDSTYQRPVYPDFMVKDSKGAEVWNTFWCKNNIEGHCFSEHKNGTYFVYAATCSQGEPLLKQDYKNDTVTGSTGYYPSGRIMFYESCITGTIKGYYENGKPHFTGNFKPSYSNYFFCFDDKIATDIEREDAARIAEVQETASIGEEISGSWTLYDSSGNIKTEASFSNLAKPYTHEDSIKLGMPNPEDPYAKSLEPVTIVKDGTWKFYNNGILKTEMVFDKGRLLQTKHF